MARSDLDRRLAVIVGLSVLAHAGIAAWALLGDPPADWLAAPAAGERAFDPDLETVVVLDGDHLVLPPAPAPGTAAPVVAPPDAPGPITRPTVRRRAAHRPDRLSDPSPQAVVDGLFGDDHGVGPGGMARRRPGSDLAHELEVARARGGSAAIGGGDVRLRGDDDPRLGRSEERRVGKECRSRWSPYH